MKNKLLKSYHCINGKTYYFINDSLIEVEGFFFINGFKDNEYTEGYWIDCKLSAPVKLTKNVYTTKF